MAEPNKKILIISPYKIYKNNLLFNLWIHTLYNLEKYDKNLQCDNYIYKYIYDDDKNQNFGYDDEIINTTVNYIINPIYDIIFFVYCAWSGKKNKFLYGEDNVLRNLLEQKKKVIITNSDYFDIIHHKYLRSTIRYNKYFYIMDGTPFDKITNIYQIPYNRFLQSSHHCCELFDKVKFNDNPKMKIFMPGNYDKLYYPNRFYFVENICPKYKDLIDVNIEHPGQIPINDNKTGINYINILNEYFACFTSSVLKEQVILNKHLEIPYVGSLMLAYSSEKNILAEYGFIDKVHYISCDENNYDDIIKYIFNPINKEEINKIRKNGYNLAREKYSQKSIAKKIIDNILCVRNIKL